MFLASLDGGLLSAGITAPQAISVDFDATFFLQVVLFVGLTLALKPMLFDPMLKLFEEREKRIDGAKILARRTDEKSAAALAKYEGEMAKARTSANVEREKIRADGLKREQEILEGVRAATNKIVEAGKQSAKTEADRARAGLKTEAAALARQLAGRVLGREVQS